MNIIVPAQFTHIIDTEGNAVRPNPRQIGVNEVWVDWGYADQLIPEITVDSPIGRYIAWRYNQELLLLRVNIGSWDMDTNASVVVPLPVEFNPLAFYPLGGYVSDDSQDAPYYQFGLGASNADGEAQLWVQDTQPSGITLVRLDGSLFDSANFSNTSVGRGWIIGVYFANTPI